jgi:hypothetical protein
VVDFIAVAISASFDHRFNVKEPQPEPSNIVNKGIFQ